MTTNTINDNAIKIQAWRDTNPDTQITEQVLREIIGHPGQGLDFRGANLTDANLTNADLRNADLTGAHLNGANLWHADLRATNLTDTNLRRAILTRAKLWGANLIEADLRGADLTGADLRGAVLVGAHLSGTYLWGANLTRASLNSANLWGVNLTGANLTGTNLTGADLTFSKGGVTQISNLYPYPVTLQPTPSGWYARVGCWYGTLEELHEIATSDDDDDWPEASGDEREQRRPLLQAILGVFDAHVANHPDLINKINNHWGE